MSLLQNIDNSILEFIKNNMHSSIMDKIMIICTYLGNGGAIWIAIAALLTISKKYRKVGFLTLGALALSAILGEGILKHLIQRTRPCIDIPAIDMLIAKPLSYSFPSGHAASAFAAVTVLSKYFKKYRIVLLGLALSIAFSRLYLYVHYPSDVIAGIILGLMCGKASMTLLQFITGKIDDSEPIAF
ncbi:undecaprenyl-diphosphatase [Clostridium saccharoperbutylacetonicum]|uniref:Phospholipid phosphatase n=1 Tax=Clostridium saccharoperbutylacetonicum N1-4(HMT) TaxID=931276 RepID=M1MH84_9CLOT|nr:phosphatase PAP2 family protein [Clostridium saccharoperbutylacetonicum]AGF55688.1 phospholipid phosphatase [Clostridium saccharoperbutylacetonicum N1-4(HMT)]NRT63586.1 undecaprenyl-diphosphatase [Clostridium saccharoperbutylacetonicum]NSB26949.1 undecaprenyl-diphosphatase [Clostridium saccharoperbutylacetonicum]NSB40433.1 undecaprenyl-diphosphatase [Clostridium saccharoperbutylacetonicum]